MERGFNSAVVISLGAVVAVTCPPLLITSCSPKVYPVERIDSVRVEIRERVVVDTATFYIEREVEKVVTKDTSSHLENTYAKSDAVMSGGLLHHSLETIPHYVKVPYSVEVRDTIFVEKVYEKEAVEVNRLTRWQSFWIRVGKVLGLIFTCVIVGAVCLLVVRIWLKV